MIEREEADGVDRLIRFRELKGSVAFVSVAERTGRLSHSFFSLLLFSFLPTFLHFYLSKELNSIIKSEAPKNVTLALPQLSLKYMKFPKTHRAVLQINKQPVVWFCSVRWSK